MDYKNELAKLFKERENKKIVTATIGEVIEAPPNLRVSIWNKQVILEPNQLYMNDRLFNDHTRDYSLEGDIEDIDLTLEKNEITNAVIPPVLPYVPNPTPPAPWSFKGEGAMKGSGTYKAKGTIINTDTLKVGDKVKLTPTESFQVWFVDFKVRKVK